MMIIDNNPTPEQLTEARLLIWNTFKDWLGDRDPDNYQINVYFDGCGDQGCIEDIRFRYCRNRPEENLEIESVALPEPITIKTWSGEKSTDSFAKVFKETIAEPMVKNIDYDWYNNDGGFGDIYFCFNPDPHIRWDVEYEGHQRYTETNLMWSKEFDDEIEPDERHW